MMIPSSRQVYARLPSVSNEAAVLVFLDTGVQVSDVDKDAPVGAHRGKLAARNHVLNRVFGATNVHGGLLNRQQTGPHVTTRSALVHVLKAGCHFLRQG